MGRRPLDVMGLQRLNRPREKVKGPARPEPRAPRLSLSSYRLVSTLELDMVSSSSTSVSFLLYKINIRTKFRLSHASEVEATKRENLIWYQNSRISLNIIKRLCHS
ncbi:hypothetical protein AAC387_Pa03g3625 [Persea americana]